MTPLPSLSHVDIAVIGGGPVGCFTALRCAKLGFRVALFEEHPVIGEPRHCTGVLGREAYERFPELPRDVIQNELKAAWIVSPGGERIRVSWFEGQAFVVQRARFDRALARMAQEAGAILTTAAQVTRFERVDDGVLLHVAEQGQDGVTPWKARAVVVAAGVSFRLHQQAGLTLPTSLLHCAQTEVGSDDFEDVEVYVGQDVAPGSFAWAVPAGKGRVRVGVTAHRKAAEHLESLLSNLAHTRTIDRSGASIVRRPIPIRSSSVSVADRVLAAGDAAGQVKPTTGGGIYYGLIGAELACETLEMAFAKNRFDRAFLASYDRRWKRELGSELLMGWMGRKVFEAMGDRKLDRLVRACRHKAVGDLVQKMADFDWHSKAVFSFLTSPRVISALF